MLPGVELGVKWYIIGHTYIDTFKLLEIYEMFVQLNSIGTPLIWLTRRMKNSHKNRKYKKNIDF